MSITAMIQERCYDFYKKYGKCPSCVYLSKFKYLELIDEFNKIMEYRGEYLGPPYPKQLTFHTFAGETLIKEIDGDLYLE